MDQLLKAVKTKYDASAALVAANTGGLYLEPQLNEAAYPYMVVYHVAGNFTDIMGGNKIKTAIVQFSIFDDDVSTAMSIYSLLCAAFDNATLSYGAGSDLQTVCLRNAETGPNFLDDVWQVTVDYQIQRT